MDALAVEFAPAARAGHEEGRFDDEIVPIDTPHGARDAATRASGRTRTSRRSPR